MKHTYYFFVFLFLLFLFACKDSILEEEMLDSKVIEEVSSGSVSVSPRRLVSPLLGVDSKSNPNLYVDWENVERIYLNNGDFITSPWKAESGNSMNIPLSIRTDIKKENGWIMLGHTLKEQGEAEPDYIFFYHTKSGVLKIFYFNTERNPNSYLTWLLQANDPSSIIPASGKIGNLIYQAEKYATTSNLLNNERSTESVPLVPGWNCCTFELPYGSVNMDNPLVGISAINTIKLKGELTGSLTGQVIIPGTSSSNALDAWTKPLGVLTDFSNAASSLKDLFSQKKDPPNTNSEPTPRFIGSIKAGLSVASGLLGGVSFFTSKTKNVTQRFNFSGDIKLSGEFTAEPGGGVYSANNIEINKLNNDQPLGVWGLNSTPKLIINKYERAFEKCNPINTDEVTMSRFILFNPVQKSSVVINPSILPLIKDYKVSTSLVYGARNEAEKLSGFFYEKLGDGWSCTDIEADRQELKELIYKNEYPVPSPYKNQIFYMEYHLPKKIVATVVVEIEYKDGTSFISTRPFEVDCETIDNRGAIIEKNSKSKVHSVFLY